MGRGRILSGMRPTGQLHIGHLSVLENWVQLQNKYDCFYFIADWHALTTCFEETGELRQNTIDIAVDWLSAGIEPEKSTVFVQSGIPEHAELNLIFSMITPLPWLERVPTYKDQVAQLREQGKDISTYGFLGYPLLQAADILMYKASAVPVGEDQLPHVELCREVSRRFNHLYGKVFPEPQSLLSKVPMIPGVDGRKMSKSYMNDISLTAGEKEIKKKVRAMITDPARIRKDDPGHPDVCIVYTYHSIYSPKELEAIREACEGGKIGCVECKNRLAAVLNKALAPIREKREEILARPGYIEDVLAEGASKAKKVAAQTMEEVHRALKF
ncbi:MAG: tryptophan--tRNA ligase [Desulfotomaculaceae bacterium]